MPFCSWPQVSPFVHGAVAYGDLLLRIDESIFVNGQTVAADNGVTGGLYLEKLLD